MRTPQNSAREFRSISLRSRGEARDGASAKFRVWEVRQNFVAEPLVRRGVGTPQNSARDLRGNSHFWQWGGCDAEISLNRVIKSPGLWSVIAARWNGLNN